MQLISSHLTRVVGGPTDLREWTAIQMCTVQTVRVKGAHAQQAVPIPQGLRRLTQLPQDMLLGYPFAQHGLQQWWEKDHSGIDMIWTTSSLHCMIQAKKMWWCCLFTTRGSTLCTFPWQTGWSSLHGHFDWIPSFLEFLWTRSSSSIVDVYSTYSVDEIGLWSHFTGAWTVPGAARPQEIQHGTIWSVWNEW